MDSNKDTQTIHMLLHLLHNIHQYVHIGNVWKFIKITFKLFNTCTSAHGFSYTNSDTLITRTSSSSDDIYYLANDDIINRQDNSKSTCHNVFLNDDTGLLYAVQTHPEWWFMYCSC